VLPYTFSDSSGDKDSELRERFVNYETELSAANRKIADCTCLAQSSNP
jgi:hypothetical protein